ncbi:hypothetical protein EHV15_35395 [Paenibacillus oralis]|uniref:Uncharacterized protein n=1 Tax=Paenibacillus oralis TaxID=2490856 RepID=A0A3P3T9Z2_9BACL|nr:hypothetical protein [Paenibacillus oralis]RRJ54861.1 hypothetical protein EHV15_35395 [Paenibacillus oralis]
MKPRNILSSDESNVRFFEQHQVIPHRYVLPENGPGCSRKASAFAENHTASMGLERINEMVPKCSRCKKEAKVTTMSRFNTDIICIPCENLEKRHPEYSRAVEVELQEVQKGNYNYPGIGRPADL